MDDDDGTVLVSSESNLEGTSVGLLGYDPPEGLSPGETAVRLSVDDVAAADLSETVGQFGLDTETATVGADTTHTPTVGLWSGNWSPWFSTEELLDQGFELRLLTPFAP
ncbi:MAG: hypothetical protein J07HB67_01351 [halophilic archaeon J07HB67]|nr:MAG: hypothetical protein J07HB67_01351 [halophilic archaeon J07HB67]